MVTVREISTMLRDRTESVAKMLLPNGRISGREYEAGSTSGEKGKSLKVRLDGEKRGIWCDFETGEKGDLLDLWRITSGMSMSETIQTAKEYLGITDPTFTGRRKTYSRPQKTPTTEISNASVEKYLTQERGLQPEFLKLYLVGSADTIGPFPTWRRQEPMAGPWITFPSYRDGELLGVKYLRLGRKDGKRSRSSRRDANRPFSDGMRYPKQPGRLPLPRVSWMRLPWPSTGSRLCPCRWVAVAETSRSGWTRTGSPWNGSS